jgi:hypothetical protein
METETSLLSAPLCLKCASGQSNLVIKDNQLLCALQKEYSRPFKREFAGGLKAVKNRAHLKDLFT